ncbi:MAG: hypothetical protein AABW41_05390, partial [Nanoarchaeota archaeon]
MGVKGGLVRSKLSYIIILISISLLAVAVTLSLENLSSNETNNTAPSDITNLNVTNITLISNEPQNFSNPDLNYTNVSEQLLLAYSNITNSTTETAIVSNVAVPAFITTTYVSEDNSMIIDARTEVYNLGNGLHNAIIYSGDVFKYYNGDYYDLISFADISTDNNLITINYLGNKNLV